jgi:3-deoxy-manno-octulosonate cytidylyltransferase (CMP-KDO synthetase)
MRVLGVIPARLGATRFPGKLLAPLRGKPVLRHVWERAHACEALERVVIATDDASIAAAASAWGADAVMTRADHASGTDRIAEVAARPEFEVYAAVVNVQGDEPLIDPDAIAAAVEPVARGEAEMATLAHVEGDRAALASPDVVKVTRDAAGDAIDFTRAAPAPDSPGPWFRHVGLYVYRRSTLARLTSLAPAPRELAARLEQLRALAHGIRIRVVITPYASRGVDTPSDLAALERDWEALTGPAESGRKESPR